MVLTHAFFTSSSQCLHAVCRLPARQRITTFFCSKENISNGDNCNFSSRGDESTDIPSVADVKLVLGIDKKASSPSDVRMPGSKDLDLSGEEEYKNPSVQKLQRVGKWLGDEGETIQERLLVFLLLSLPIWTFAVLVAGGFIQLPFSLSFVEN